MGILKKISILIFTIISVLLSSSIYRAYVLFKPCQHDLKPLDGKNKIKINQDQLERLQNSLKIDTVSYSRYAQNFEGLKNYVEFIKNSNNQKKIHENNFY